MKINKKKLKEILQSKNYEDISLEDMRKVGILQNQKESEPEKLKKIDPSR